VVLLTGYMAGMVRETLGDRYAGMRLRYCVEPEPLGTGGALRLALPLVTTPAVLLLNGDSYCDVSVAELRDFHGRHAADASLTLSYRANTAHCGHVLAAGDRIGGFAEKAVGGPGWANAGVYLINRDTIETIPAGRAVSLEREVLPAWATHRRLFGLRWAGSFLDIGSPETYGEAEAYLRAAS
jgi:NDP-sugar pyrophosphorylase family protein